MTMIEATLETTDLVLIHYGELALNGRNRHLFERQLMDNLKSRLRGYPGAKVRRHFGRLYVEFDPPAAWPLVRAALRQVFGLASFMPAVRVAPHPEVIEAAVLKLLHGRDGQTFKIDTNRVDKNFPITSPEFNRRVGATVLKALPLKVDVHNPQALLRIEIMHDAAFLYCDADQGRRGLPVGCTGKVLSLISGGIDSPISTLRMLKRGCRVALLHFHSAPYTDTASQHKAKEFADYLRDYQRPIALYMVALAPIQQAVVQHCRSEFRVILYRRYMMRIAEAIAYQEKAKALVTGDSLAQVASQTLENIATINASCALPILRPLLGMDKEEIIREAKDFGTFDLSIEDAQDCCSFLSTRHPAIKSRARDLERDEAILQEKAAVKTLMQQAIDTAAYELYE